MRRTKALLGIAAVGIAAALPSAVGAPTAAQDQALPIAGLIGNETSFRSVYTIAPYEAAREEARALVEKHGRFVLVHLSTPLEICEQRDVKGLYAKARAGIIKEFTGISDPYEEPQDADVVIDTATLSPEEAAQEILLFLEKEGYVGDSLVTQ